MWYTKVLGIEPYFDQPFYVGFNVSGYELGLQPDDTAAGVRADGAVAYWGVADADAVFKELIASGRNDSRARAGRRFRNQSWDG